MSGTFAPYAILIAAWTAKFGASQNSYIALCVTGYIVMTVFHEVGKTIVLKVLKYTWPVLLLALGAAIGVYFEELRTLAREYVFL